MIMLWDKVMLSSLTVFLSMICPLLYIAGHVARNARSYNECTESKDLFRNKESRIDLDIDRKYLEYIDYLDRGGLLYPSIFFKSYKYHILILMCVLVGIWKNHS